MAISEAKVDDTRLAGTKAHLGVAVLAHGLLRIATSADGTLVGLYLAVLARSHSGQSVGLAGLFGATAYVAEVIGSVPLGLAADVMPIRVLMATGAGATAIAIGALALTTSTPAWFLSRLALGVGLAAVTPPLLASLASSTQRLPSGRARLMGLFELSMLAGLALGGVVGSQLWVRLGEFAFAILAIVAVACAVIFLVSGATRPQAPMPYGLQGLRDAFANPVVRRLAPVWLCVNAVVGLWLGPTLIFLLTQHDRTGQYLVGLFAANPARVGWLLLGYSAVFASGVLLWSLVLTPARLLGSLHIALFAMLAVCACLFALNHSTEWTHASRASLVVGTAVLIMIESGFTPTALTCLAQALSAVRGKGAAMGIYSLLLGIGAAMGSLLAAALSTLWQVDGLLLGTVLLALVALVLLSRIARVGETAEVGGSHG